ncbi:response regulator [Nonomuraea sp. SYSU D8015]|uniref:response regulator n=1 Tax=Nonomuraea sp. SYSU D8015 TaxID=2593644 RepID=UPI0016602632|nr:response regulator transcription factor [Nonomuraea sp. SYSU D8015]
MTIRVLIADDQGEVRSALRLVLDAEPDIEVIAEAADGAQAIRCARAARPDIVIMDLRMPRMDGLSAIRALTAPAPEQAPTVIALTTFDLDEYVFGSLQAGAAGFLLKDNEPRVLIEAVRVAHRGHALIDPQVTKRLIRRFAALSPGPPPAALGRLTPREREVLALVGEGLTNAEIARTLWIEEGTVKTHVNRILTKLGLRTRVHAALYAHQHGITR